MIVKVVPDPDLPYVLVEGICSDRALGVLLRAVPPWYAFGRYDDVIVDLASFDDWSPRVVEQLAAAVTKARDVGHWIGFFPVGEHRIRGADPGQINGYPDRARAQLAMYEHRLAWRRHGRRSVRQEVMRKFRHALSRPPVRPRARAARPDQGILDRMRTSGTQVRPP
jgi:hypothetical protein